MSSSRGMPHRFKYLCRVLQGTRHRGRLISAIITIVRVISITMLANNDEILLLATYKYPYQYHQTPDLGEQSS
jgi:hypothetical protein